MKEFVLATVDAAGRSHAVKIAVATKGALKRAKEFTAEKDGDLVQRTAANADVFDSIKLATNADENGATRIPEPGKGMMIPYTAEANYTTLTGKVPQYTPTPGSEVVVTTPKQVFHATFKGERGGKAVVGPSATRPEDWPGQKTELAVPMAALSAARKPRAAKATKAAKAAAPAALANPEELAALLSQMPVAALKKVSAAMSVYKIVRRS